MLILVWRHFAKIRPPCWGQKRCWKDHSWSFEFTDGNRHARDFASSCANRKILHWHENGKQYCLLWLNSEQRKRRKHWKRAHVASNCDNHSCLVSSISLSFSVMVYQSKMFTHTICCCSATVSSLRKSTTRMPLLQVASQVMAIIAIILCAIVAVTNWFYDYSIYFSIYQVLFS